MEDTLDILTRAMHWDGDRDDLVKLITDIADAAYDLGQADAARYAITRLLGDSRVPPIWRPQLEIYMVTLVKDTAIAAKHLRNAESDIAKLDEICHATGITDKRLKDMHIQLADYRTWYEEDCPEEWDRANAVDTDWSEEVFRVVYKAEDRPKQEPLAHLISHMKSVNVAEEYSKSMFEGEAESKARSKAALGVEQSSLTQSEAERQAADGPAEDQASVGHEA